MNPRVLAILSTASDTEAVDTFMNPSMMACAYIVFSLQLVRDDGNGGGGAIRPPPALNHLALPYLVTS
jgi:hypothetical protein